MTAPPQDRSRVAATPSIPATPAAAAFTLLEILLAIAVVAALVSLSLAGTRHLAAQAREARCQNNLRQLGAAFFAFAGDHNMRLHLFSYKDAGSSVSWLNYLSGNVTSDHTYSSKIVSTVYLPPSDVALCPDFAPRNYLTTARNNIYASHPRDPNDPASFIPPGRSSTSAGVTLSLVSDPASYWLLADSYHGDTKKQIYIVQSGANQPTGMHFRHRNRAHVLYADGHVSAEDFETMKNLPVNAVTSGFDAEGNRLR